MRETRYDPEADVLHVAFGPAGATYDGAQEVAPGVCVEFDVNGHPVGVEITSVSWISAGSPGAQVGMRPAEQAASSGPLTGLHMSERDASAESRWKSA